ncbi:DUF4124 domain-containing protein [Dokdonella sp.]|uniref:DUF4124 domain-containing protein n=1 Tax=Dokdonella sp. TaxID=2291710 RepID=UPI002601706E|nr:DUF4124 domain-containing protein [Dokdonella sp.]
MRCIRSLLRWFAASLLPVAMAQAATVYECRGADGAIAWQDRSCAASQRQAEVEIAPPPPYAPSPEYRPVPASRVDARADARRVPKHGGSREPARSWECRAANGDVFYRHGSCPASLPPTDAASPRRGAGPPRIGVTATPLPRDEACRRMAAERGRAGRSRDERASTYERNLGRDPCRRP